MREPTARPDQHHFFADLDEAPLMGVDVVDEHAAPAGMWKEAWNNLRYRPLFWVSLSLIVLVIVIALFPSWFTSVDPKSCHLTNSLRARAPVTPSGTRSRAATSTRASSTARAPRSPSAC